MITWTRRRRPDVDPFSARGLVQDYKSGKGAHSARDIERELRLQIPLYMLVLRDLVGFLYTECCTRSGVRPPDPIIQLTRTAR